METEGGRRRLTEVDRVTGFAIFLVVVGHVVARQPPNDAEWYVALKFYIYQFHMPLFMFLSGMVFQYTYTPAVSLSDYVDWARKKIVRLAPGFLLIGTAIALAKPLAASVIHVDNAQSGDFLRNLADLFLRPTESVASSLWYVYVLLELYLLFPLLDMLLRGRRLAIMGIALGLHVAHLFLALPTTIAIHAVSEFSLYFWLGALACGVEGAAYDENMARVRRAAPIFVALFAASFATTLFLTATPSKTLIGLASIPAAFALVGRVEGRLGRTLLFVSRYSFVIYLLNTIAIGVTKGAMLRVMSWDGASFYFFFVVLTLVGMVGPILAHRWIFSRQKTLARIMN